MTQANVLAQLGSTSGPTFRNRIISGAMVIDQRNAGASVTPNGTYTLDRWKAGNSQTGKFTVQQNAGAVTPPVGFSNYLGITSSSAYSVSSSDEFTIFQPIEGYNFADLGWGTANAKTVTLSFQVYSSLTGTFGGALNNAATNRSYPFSYSIPVANTWTTVSVTIAGDTTGTWVGATNGVGVYVQFSIGAGSTKSGTAGSWAGTYYVSVTGATSVVGTNGATFYITGVQLEVGSSATGFEYRQYGQELALCTRYAQPVQGTLNANNQGGAGAPFAQTLMFQQMRTSPTFSTNTGAANSSAATTTMDTITPYSVRMYSTTTASGNVQINYTGLATAEL